MPPSTDQVQSSTNQYRLILTQFLQVRTSSALYWPSATKYQRKNIILQIFSQLDDILLHIRGWDWPGLPVIFFNWASPDFAKWWPVSYCTGKLQNPTCTQASTLQDRDGSARHKLVRFEGRRSEIYFFSLELLKWESLRFEVLFLLWVYSQLWQSQLLYRKEDVVDDRVSHVSSLQTRHEGDLQFLIQFWTLERDEELESFKMSFIPFPFTHYCLLASKYLSDFHYPIILSLPYMHNKRWI